MNKAKREGKGERAALFKELVDWIELKGDSILNKLDKPMVDEESREIVQEVVEKNDQVRFERVRRWLKENALAISGVTIMMASLITSVVALTRKAVKVGKTAVDKLSKAVKAIAKKLGPIMGPVFSLQGNIISLGAKGLGFLAENLWLFLLLILYAAYKEVRRKKGD